MFSVAELINCGPSRQWDISAKKKRKYSYQVIKIIYEGNLNEHY